MPLLNLKKKTKSHDAVPSGLADIVPISDVGPDYLIRKDGRYCAIFAVSPVNMSLISSEDAHRVVQSIREACNSAPSRLQITVSSERLNLDDYITYLQRFIDQAKDPGQLEHLESMINFIQNRSVRSEKILKFYLTIESQFQKESAAISELATSENLIRDALKPEGVFINRLAKHEILGLLYQKLNPKTSALEPAHRELKLADIYPSEINTKNPSYAVMDETYFRSYTISSFPTKQNSASWLSPIFEMPLDMDVTLTLTPTDKEEVLKDLNKTIRTIRIKKSEVETKDPLHFKSLDRQEQDADHIMEQLSNENESLFQVTILITLREHNLEELRLAERSLRTRISSRKMQSRFLNNWAFQPLWYSLPICYQGELEKKIRYNMPAETIGSMQPFNSSTLAGNDGIVLGINEQSHDLIVISNELRKQNPHTTYLATTRAGKSFALSGDVSRKLAQSEICIDVDPERERGHIPGNHIIFGLNHDTCINVFHIRSTVCDSDNERAQESTKPGDYLRLKCDRNLNFFRWIYPQLDTVQAAAIQKAQIEAYKQYGLDFSSEHLPESFPTLGEFYGILERMKIQGLESFVVALSPYVGEGTYAKMFDGQTSWSFTEKQPIQTEEGLRTIEVPHPYTRLDIHELPATAQAPLMDLLLNDMWEFVKLNRSVVKNLYVDEAWIVADPENPHTLNFLYQMAKRGGKYGVRLTTATQNVNDFLKTKPGSTVAPGQAIISLSGIKLLMKMDEKEISQISEFVPLSDKERKVLRSAEQGHGIIIVGTQHAQIHTFMTEAEWKQYDPERYQTIFA